MQTSSGLAFALVVLPSATMFVDASPHRHPKPDGAQACLDPAFGSQLLQPTLPESFLLAVSLASNGACRHAFSTSLPW